MNTCNLLPGWAIRVVACLVLLAGCTSSDPVSKLEYALEQSGKNKAELSLLLEYYSKHPADSLKYRAACFLIENMPEHYTSAGAEREEYWNKLRYIFRDPNLTYEDLLAQSKKISAPSWEKEKQEDIKYITANHLISHIEAAFEIWAYPWCQELSFADFCEYVLPYRLSHEPLENWMPKYREYLLPFLRSIDQNKEIDTSLCRSIATKHLKNPVTTSDILYPFLFDSYPSELLAIQTKWSFGSCHETALLGAYAMRSLGIPVAYEFTPEWANRRGRHAWLTLPTHETSLTFQAKENLITFGYHIDTLLATRMKLSKAYRLMYSIQEDSLPFQNISEKTPVFFQNMHMKDVTERYGECFDVTIELTTPPPAHKDIAYIMTWNNQEWIPVHWGKISNDVCTFTKMRPDNLYMVMYYHRKQFYPACSPLVLRKNGEYTLYNPDENRTRTVSLSRKYPNINTAFVLDQMRGGIFQGSNTPEFKEPKDLYTIDSITDVTPYTINLRQGDSFLYFRYLSAKNGFVSMAEIELYDNNDQSISGEVIGTEGCRGIHRDRSKVFDHDPLTFFSSLEPTGAWVGLAFNKPQCIHKIVYLPRNDDNYIKANQQYELFYYDRGWISLGQQKISISGGNLLYTNVPDNALLLLRNLTKGAEERIFTYNTQQEWW